MTCSVDNCAGKVRCRGLCNAHYRRYRRHGDPLGGGPSTRRPVDERFDENYEVKANGCWEWTGSRSDQGYGYLSVSGQNFFAHRLAYARFSGPIPEGLTLDHLCRNRACCNPAHLEPVTRAENARRGARAKLSAEAVAAIRVLLDRGWEQRRVAERFGIDQSQISRIKNGLAWC